MRDILPCSVEYLWLAKTDQAEFGTVEPQLLDLLALRSDRFPLRKLVIQFYQVELIPGKELSSVGNESNAQRRHWRTCGEDVRPRAWSIGGSVTPPILGIYLVCRPTTNQVIKFVHVKFFSARLAASEGYVGSPGTYKEVGRF